MRIKIIPRIRTRRKKIRTRGQQPKEIEELKKLVFGLKNQLDLLGEMVMLSNKRIDILEKIK